MIQHDVKRLDRLISDISDASRLDAELQRGEMAPVDLAKLLNTVVTVQNETRQTDVAKVSLTFEGGGPLAFVVPGHDSRLGQVVNNLIDNARSFAPPEQHGARHLPAAARRGRDRRGRRRPGHPPGRLRQDLRALLHRPAAPGLRAELRARPVDLQADHRSPRRPPVGGEPRRRRDVRRRARPRCWARASWCGCRPCDGWTRNRAAQSTHVSHHPRLRGPDRRARRADPGAVRIGQVAAGARAAAGGGSAARCRLRGWSPTIAPMSRRPMDACWCGRRRRWPA